MVGETLYWLLLIFFQGWCGSADPRKRGTGTKSAEVKTKYFHVPVFKGVRAEEGDGRGSREEGVGTP